MEINATASILYMIEGFSAVLFIPIIAMFALLSAVLGLYWGVSRFMRWVSGDGMTSGLSRDLYKISPRFSAWYDHMTYRPFKGSPRGWQLRLGQKFNIKKWQV